MTKPNKIEFTATVASVKTLADFGIRISLDLSENEVTAAAQLMQARADGVVLRITIEADASEVLK